MTKPYRLKHLPTGLYYRCATGYDWVKTNLSKTGKVYLTNTSAISGNRTVIGIQITAKQYNNMKDIFSKYKVIRSCGGCGYFFWCPKSDFELETLI